MKWKDIMETETIDLTLKELKSLNNCPECGAPTYHAGGCIECVCCDWGLCG